MGVHSATADPHVKRGREHERWPSDPSSRVWTPDYSNRLSPPPTLPSGSRGRPRTARLRSGRGGPRAWTAAHPGMEDFGPIADRPGVPFGQSARPFGASSSSNVAE